MLIDTVIGLLVCGCFFGGILLLWAIRMIVRLDYERKFTTRLQAAIEAGRLERDAEAHQANVAMRWEG